MPKKDPDKILRARWDKRENDILYLYPSKPDGHLLHYVFDSNVSTVIGRSLLDELVARGYDLKTLKFSIEKKVDAK